MAYITKTGGPYPNKKDEFCGNHRPNEDADWRDPDWRNFEIEGRKQPTRVRFGRPHPCAAGTTEELEEQGFVGLYLQNDHPLMDGETEVETPEKLKEPT